MTGARPLLQGVQDRFRLWLEFPIATESLAALARKIVCRSMLKGFIE